MLKVKNLSVGYGDGNIVSDVNFEVDRGFSVILGQNGSGKTTLFRALSGSVRSTGEVTLDGENLLGLSPKQRAQKLAQVLGTHQTLSGITCEMLAEMAFYPSLGLLRGVGRKERERIYEVAREMGIEDLLTRQLDKISSGERQMAELLSAVCQNTELLLLDEPTAALDFNRTHNFLSRTRELSKSRIILATLHDPSLALQYAERVFVLGNGKIIGNFMPSQTDENDIESVLRQIYPQIRINRTCGELNAIGKEN